MTSFLALTAKHLDLCGDLILFLAEILQQLYGSLIVFLRNFCQVRLICKNIDT